MAEKALEAGLCSGRPGQRDAAKACWFSERGTAPAAVPFSVRAPQTTVKRRPLPLPAPRAPVADVSATFPLCPCSLALDVRGHWGRPRPQEMSG